MVVDNAEAALRAARSGVGIALLPLGVAAHDLLSGRLVRVLGDCRQDGGAFHVVFPSNRHMPAAQRAFIDHVVAESEVMLARHAKAAAMQAGPLPGELRPGSIKWDKGSERSLRKHPAW
ncbi:LysR substrate-binding domain-containing protein [Mesorhizobium ventifaucium]|uniref:LysR substrate-binding domain-containing protein n=1 Tax=Mesorhizobium ventifaucium TaxID=666020 RepID=A0ABN8JFW8_9HYPH|nr:LysR substrate-binding domain-containing protein [Mesorhizobium ventifaucium]CAH2396731.1 hypothetical protein MES4922_170125 [Mesorhizobium ventifaucium]